MYLLRYNEVGRVERGLCIAHIGRSTGDDDLLLGLGRSNQLAYLTVSSSLVRQLTRHFG